MVVDVVHRAQLQQQRASTSKSQRRRSCTEKAGFTPSLDGYRGEYTGGSGMSDGAGAEGPGCTGLDGATVVQRDGTVALHDLTLLARPGELLAVLGPSGSGKSTLLRAIAGLAKLQSGRVLVAGRPTSSDPAQRDLAMVFETDPVDATARRGPQHGFRALHPQGAGAGGRAPRRPAVPTAPGGQAAPPDAQPTVQRRSRVRSGSVARWSAPLRRSCWTSRSRTSTSTSGPGCAG